jgi:hypothetical protein
LRPGPKATLLAPLLCAGVVVAGCAEPSPEQRAADTLGRVEGIRGLSLLQEVPYRFESPRTAFDDVLDDWRASDEIDLATRRAEVLERLGLLPRDYDIVGTAVAATREGVAGFYDPERKSITVVTDAAEPGSGELLVLAHEVTHALQDQHYGLQRLQEGLDEDAAYAMDALIEGDATLAMAVWIVKRHAIDGIDELKRDDIPTDVLLLDDVPPVLLRGGEFPYVDGAAFVFSQWHDGDWRHIDDIWAAPPVSTEQILHPERYPDDVPELVEVPGLAARLGEGWAPVHEMVLGEMIISVLLADGEPWDTDELDAFESPVLANAEAAAGWGGDRLVHLHGPRGSWLIVWQTAWDSAEDATEFAAVAREALDDLDHTTGVIAGAHASASRHAHPVLVLIASDDPTYVHAIRTIEPFDQESRASGRADDGPGEDGPSRST